MFTIPGMTLDNAHELLDLMDGMLLTGSFYKLHPSTYNEPVTTDEGFYDPARDNITIPLVRAALERELPIFGICRGMQELNVALGSSLVQVLHDEPGRNDHRPDESLPLVEQFAPANAIHIQPGGVLSWLIPEYSIEVSTAHMQGVNRVAKGMTVCSTWLRWGFCNDIGVRWMLMVYNRANLAGSGCHDAVDDGLTAFGREVVREMDRVGIIKCCTHTGYRTAMDVLTMSERPCIFSHSNPRALRDHPRNIPNELIDACAATGGVVGITGIGIFLGDNDSGVATFVNHIDYVKARVGIEHVAIGLDYVFDQKEMDFATRPSSIWPAGFGYQAGIKFVAPEDLSRLTADMLRPGYADSEVRAVLGENLLRVVREVWQ